MPDEAMLYGTAPELFRRCSEKEMKGEFVIVIEGRVRDAK
jgi:16S rRNA C1402 (ribose-2'-O) methylase RsmI